MSMMDFWQYVLYPPAMSRTLCRIAAFVTGAVISVMVIFNTELGQATTNNVSILINQVVGIVLLSALLVLFRGNGTVNPARSKAPWYMWFGGLFGLVVITCNYFSVTKAGATISMGSAVLGQCIAGLVLDASGWMWMKKRRIGARRIASAAVVAAGIAVMLLLSGEKIHPLYALIGVAAGIITMMQMAYNSHFASYKGAFFSARQNVISGLAGIALFALCTSPEATMEALKAVPGIPFIVIIGGGTLACFVVVSSNTIIPRIPGADSSALMSAGQVLAASLLDWAIYGRAYPSLIAGSAIIIAGIAIAWNE